MIIAADNLNPMNLNIASAISEKDPEILQNTTRQCSSLGSDLLDINPGYLSAMKTDRIAFMVETVQEVTDCRLILDSAQPEVLKMGLSVCKLKPVISALTLEPKKIDEILPLALEADTDLVILLLDEKSICPSSMEEKLSIALEIWQKAKEAGMSTEKLIFDPVVPNISWPDAWENLRASVRTIRMLADGSLLGEPVKTMAGISNFLSGQRKYNSPEVEQTILSVLGGAGLSVSLMDVTNKALMDSCEYIKRMI